MIYVMADIHGHRRRFDSIMKQINLQPEDTLYILGDVIDRNEDGIRILRQIMKMPNAVMLLGNHENMMLSAIYHTYSEDALEDNYFRGRVMSLWYRNGGNVTHNYLKHIRKSIRQEIFEYLLKLPINLEISVNGKKYLLTHAAPMDEYQHSALEYDDEKEYALWHRYHRYDCSSSDRVVIFGHTGTFKYQANNPTRIWHGLNLIGIDCGAAYEPQDFWNRDMHTCLACLRLDDMKEFYSEEPMEVENEQRVQGLDSR